jgi:hypothetical protein
MLYKYFVKIICKFLEICAEVFSTDKYYYLLVEPPLEYFSYLLF